MDVDVALVRAVLWAGAETRIMKVSDANDPMGQPQLGRPQRRCRFSNSLQGLLSMRREVYEGQVWQPSLPILMAATGALHQYFQGHHRCFEVGGEMTWEYKHNSHEIPDAVANRNRRCGER